MAEHIEKKVRKLSYGVYIIGAEADGRLNGMTAAWVSQVSEFPPMVSVCIDASHYTSEMIEKSRAFSVNVLSEKHFDLAMKCGFGSGRNTQRLKDVEIEYKLTGSPIIKGAAAFMDCELRQIIDIGDGRLFIGEVVASGENDLPGMKFDAKRFFDR